MTPTTQQLSDATARKVFVRQMIFFAVLLTLSAIDKTYTALADLAREGKHLPLWKPLIWELSSGICGRFWDNWPYECTARMRSTSIEFARSNPGITAITEFFSKMDLS